MRWPGRLLVASTFLASGCVSRLITEGDSAGDGDGGVIDDDDRDSYGESEGDPCQANPCTPEQAHCCAAGSGCTSQGCEQACSAEVLCGPNSTDCCDSLEVCIEGHCAAPDTPCGDGYDCPEGELCDPILGVCIPSDGGGCVAVGAFDQLQTRVEWTAEMLDVLSIPVVANLDDDPQSEIVVVSARSDELGGSNPPHTENGDLWILDGRTGDVQLHIDADESNPVFPNALPVDTPLGIAAPGLADVDGNGSLEIVYGARRIDDTDYSWVRAVSLTGEALWQTSSLQLAIRRSSPSMADFDGDGRAEAVFGAAIVGDGGVIVATAAYGGRDEDAPLHGSNDAIEPGIPRGNGGLSIIVDLDGNGDPEVITGRRAWDLVDGSLVELWDAGGSDGWPAIADLDLDGLPEVALVSEGTVRVLDARTGQPWRGLTALSLPGGGRGGPPAIADFDGDGLPEIGVAAAFNVLVLDADADGLRVRWTASIVDEASSGTGVSAFDFQGDGAVELLMGDECVVRVYDGSDGHVVLELPNTQSTSREYPLVADVDADGRAEIITVANTFASENCPGQAAQRGVFVYGAEGQVWTPVRRVWTSHAHRLTTSDGFGRVPRQLTEDWGDPVRNSMRTAGFGPGATAAADLDVDVSSSCSADRVLIVARIRNGGAVSANVAGVEVELRGPQGELVSSQTLTSILVPGEVAQVVFEVASPAVGMVVQIAPAPAFEECDTTNNAADVPDRSCP